MKVAVLIRTRGNDKKENDFFILPDQEETMRKTVTHYKLEMLSFDVKYYTFSHKEIYVDGILELTTMQS